MTIARISCLLFIILFADTAWANLVLPTPSYFTNSAYSSFNNGNAVTDNNYSQGSYLYWPARVTGWGLEGDRGVGAGDAMLPVWGNSQAMVYIDLQGKYASDQSWFGGGSVGMREIYQDQQILGAYLFIDGDRFDNPTGLSNSSFWFVSPGVESLGNHWDFRANGYIPVSSRANHVGTTFADNLGNFSFVVLQQHQQLDHVLDVYNATGPGADVEIGHVIPGLINTRAYLGTYYFAPKNSTNIYGISGRAEYPINHFIAVTASDSYDNEFHNSFEAGVRLTLGGIDDDVAPGNRDISRRMLTPIMRNLATLSQGAGQPVVVATQDEGNLVLERDNIYFFTSTGGTTFNAANGTQNCTFEHPCSSASFTQANVNSLNGIAPNTNLYFDPGTYTATGSGTFGGLFLNGGQSIFGRDDGYVRPASISNLPLFDGGFSVGGDNTIDSVEILDSSAAVNAGLQVANAGNVVLSNSIIGTPNLLGSYSIGVSVTGPAQLTIVNSDINSFSNTSSSTGILAAGNSDITIKNSIVTAASSATGIADAIFSQGTLTIQNSSINATSAVFARDFSLVTGVANVSASQLNASASGSGSTVGFTTTGDAQVNLSNSSINSAVTGTGTALGLSAAGTSRVTINDSSVNASNTGAGTSTGINTSDSAQVAVNNSTLSVFGAGTNLVTSAGTSVVTIANSQCVVNGVTVSCP